MKNSRTLLTILTVLAPLQLVQPAFAGEEESNDDDRDGVADAIDPCPASPAGVRSIVPGCTLVDLAGAPQAVGDPVSRAIASAAQEAEDNDDLTRMADAIRAALEPIQEAQALIRQGDLCRGADVYQEGVRLLEDAAAQENAQVSSLLRSLQTSGIVDEEASEDADMRYAQARFAVKQTEAALRSAIEVGDPFDAMCAMGVADLKARGTIVSLDEAHRRMVLSDGQLLALPEADMRSPLDAGMDVTVSGISFGDGTGVALSPEPALGITVNPNLPPPPCVAFRIAPVQPFPDRFPSGDAPGTGGEAGLSSPNGPYVLHPIDGYRGYIPFDAYYLEMGMRVAAEAVSCSLNTSPTTGRVWYKDVIKVSTRLNGAANFTTLVYSLKASTTPVALPKTGSGELKLETLRYSCYGSDPCTLDGTISTKTYYVEIYSQGAYATASYDKVAFDFDGSPKLHRPAKVIDIETDMFSPLNDVAYTFYADGFKPQTATANGSEYQVQPMTVVGNATFGIFPFEPCAAGQQDPAPWSVPMSGCEPFADAATQLEYTGVDHNAGLRWPRVVGSRNGKPFAYSVKLPVIARDMLDACPNSVVDGYYKAPFTPGTTTKVGQGNCGTFTHGCGGSQEFAFDMGNPLNTPLHASRGGLVTALDESLSANCGDNDPNTPWCPGNTLTILHEDGTRGWYVHFPMNGISVAVGDRVLRGDQIGVVGNTGFSTGPHVHFQANDLPGTSMPMRFQTFTWAGNQPTYRTCYLPVKGDVLSAP